MNFWTFFGLDLDSSPPYESESQLGLESSSPSLESERTNLEALHFDSYEFCTFWRLKLPNERKSQPLKLQTHQV